MFDYTELSKRTMGQNWKKLSDAEQAEFVKNAEAYAKVIAKSVEIPIDYRLVLKDNGWKVYDISIEGVSLASNYRTQFKEILINKSSGEFLEILRKKVSTI